MPFSDYQKNELLKAAAPDLLHRIEVTAVVLAELLKEGVINDGVNSELSVATLDKVAKAERLIKHLYSGSRRRFLKFCNIMDKLGETQVLEILDITISEVQTALDELEEPNPDLDTSIENLDYAYQISDLINKPWEKDNVEYQGLVQENKDMRQNLILGQFVFEKVLRITNHYEHLIELKVFENEDEFTVNDTKTQKEQVTAFMTYLKQGKEWMVHAFCRTLAVNDRENLIMYMFQKDCDIKFRYMDKRGNSSRTSSMSSSTSSTSINSTGMSSNLILTEETITAPANIDT